MYVYYFSMQYTYLGWRCTKSRVSCDFLPFVGVCGCTSLPLFRFLRFFMRFTTVNHFVCSFIHSLTLFLYFVMALICIWKWNHHTWFDTLGFCIICGYGYYYHDGDGVWMQKNYVVAQRQCWQFTILQLYSRGKECKFHPNFFHPLVFFIVLLTNEL